MELVRGVKLLSLTAVEKLHLLQKRALRLMNFSTKIKSERAIPYFINLNILPVHFLYVESVSCYDIQNKLASVHIQNLFKHVSDIHFYNTRSAIADKFYIMSSLLDQLKNSFSRFGARLWNTLPPAGGGGGVLLGILGRAVPPGPPNPDPISDQNMPFSTLLFRPGL